MAERHMEELQKDGFDQIRDIVHMPLRISARKVEDREKSRHMIKRALLLGCGNKSDYRGRNTIIETDLFEGDIFCRLCITFQGDLWFRCRRVVFYIYVMY